VTVLSFHPGTHTYEVDGRPVVSVTQAMKRAGVIDTTWYTEWARDRGTRVHKAIQYHCEGDLDTESVHASDWPYLKAFMRFELEKGWEPHETEMHVVDVDRGFAGTLDGLGMLDNKLTIADYKTGPPTRAVDIQLSGYAVALKAMTGQIAQQLIALQLKTDGTYRVHKAAFVPRIFLAALEVARWKANH
jgi:hypothetical protein